MTISDFTTEPLQTDFVSWFRDSSPYIHAHRNRTFVVFFSGEAVSDNFASLIHDFAVLKSLGIRLVLVHGIRPQIDQRLNNQGIKPRLHNNLRITSEEILQYVKEAAGLVRVETEARLSMGLPNSPMAGARIRVASGNFVTARPLGVIEGVDFCHTGRVRRIDHQGIHQQLDLDNIVLISPIGYSPSGEVFNLGAEQVATEIAIALQAEKLILLTERDWITPDNQQNVRQMTTRQADLFLQQNPDLPEPIALSLQAAIESNRRGVKRVHLINRHIEGALLLELFSRDGVGTLVSPTPFEEIRPATLEDIGGILELIQPLELTGQLVKRSREKLEIDINDYIVIERDGLIIGCTALHKLLDSQAGEIACLAVHHEYRGENRGDDLLDFLLNHAQEQGLKNLYALSSQTMHWFIERGFIQVPVEHLPEQMKNFYNYNRNSKVFVKVL
jgi:amino-acid N-acetyltransferase